MPEYPSRPKENGLPIVYSRKRFRKKKDDGYLMSVADGFQIQDSDKEDVDVLIDCKIDPKKLMWSIGGNGLLKLNPALIPFQEFYTQLSLPIHPLFDFSFGSCTARFSRISLLRQYGKIVSTWPKVYLEVLFVDNEVGSRFFLLEGCLKQAVVFVFVVLTLFCDTNKLGECAEWQIPVCSKALKGCIQYVQKHSNWLYLDLVFQKHCLIAKKLPLPECPLENIKALKGGSNLHMNHLSWESSQGSRRKNSKDFIPTGLIKSGKGNGRQAPNCSGKHGMLPFSLSFSAAPLFFRSLHLKLLMRSTIACVRLRECTLACSMELRENTCNSTTSCWAVPRHFSEIFRQVFPESTLETSLSGDHHFEYLSCTKAHLETHPETASLNCYGVISSQHKSFGTTNTRNFGTLPLGEICSIRLGERTNDVHIGFGNRHKKPQTQVRYVMPSGGSKFSSRHKPLNQDLQSFKRHRRASEKRTSSDTKGSHIKLESLACDSNVLITLGDRCWRKSGMRVVLEFPDQNEWSLAVKFSGSTEYSHKVHHVFQPGSTNRYTREVIISIYQHWQQKRKRTGMPLIRHLQPPSWERYQLKMQEWNQFTTKGNTTAVCGNKVKAPIAEKPAMFAFCLKPGGLKMPNKGSKCRSQKKVHVAGRRLATNIGDEDGVHTFVRDEMASYQRSGKRNRVERQDMEFPDWPSQKRHQSELYPGKGNMHLGLRDSDEFRLRKASDAAKHASYIAVLKREKAQRLIFKADFAINVAASALMVASAIKASYRPTD